MCVCVSFHRVVVARSALLPFSKEPYKRDYILQKRPIILRSLNASGGWGLGVEYCYLTHSCKRHYIFICVTWLNSCKRHYIFICATWHIQLCNMTHIFICVTWLNSCKRHYIFICVTWLNHIERRKRAACFESHPQDLGLWQAQLVIRLDFRCGIRNAQFMGNYRVAKTHRTPWVAGNFSQDPLIIGLFFGKWPTKIRHPMGLRHPVHCS